MFFCIIVHYIQLWWLNFHGEQPLYDIEMEAQDAAGQSISRLAQRVGFKQIGWRPCQDVAKEADPWLCVINGKPVFLQGVNWTPVRPNFADVTEAEIRSRLQTYADSVCSFGRNFRFPPPLSTTGRQRKRTPSKN